MKRSTILSFILIVFGVQHVVAQRETRLVDNHLYEQLKMGNMLTGLEKIKDLSSGDEFRVTPSLPQPLTTGCDYWIPRDGSWPIVPFTNGTPPQYRNDDGSTALITLPFSFCFYGTLLTQLYINNNGNVSFGAPYTTFTGAPFPNTNFVMVAPFWSDVDTRGVGSGLVYYKLTASHLIVQWENVGYFNAHVDKRNSFQLVLSDGNDPIIRQGKNVSFCYKNMEWTTGDASGGTNGFGGTAATVGINRGDGIDYIQFGRFDRAGGSYDGPYGASDGIDFLDNTYFSLDACFPNANIPPIVNSLSGCDTLHICAGDTFLLNATYSSPEPTQVTTTSFFANGLSGTTVLSNTSGSQAGISVQIVAQQSDVGYHTVYLSAIDDGSPPEALAVTVVVHVLAASSAAFTIAPSACLGDTVSLNFSGAGVPSTIYSWNFAGGRVISGTGSGPYEVQWNSPGSHHVLLSVSDQGSCTDSSEAIIQVNQIPVAFASHEDLNCFGDNSGLASVTVATGNPPFNILWNTTPAQSGDTAFNLSPGNYTVVVSDLAGCTTQQNVTINEPPALVMISQFVNDSCGTSNGSATVRVNGGTAPFSYRWNGGPFQPSPALNKIPEGFYSVMVKDFHGCVTSGSGNIVGGPRPEARFDFNPDVVFLYDPKCVFTDHSVNAVQWHWDFADGETSSEKNPVHFFKKDGLLTVTETVYNIYGCTDTYEKEIYVDGFSSFYLPSTFTPDNDGKNDVFIPFTTGVIPVDYQMQIFDRWGKILFSSDDILRGWDGKNSINNSMVPGGMYVYRFVFYDYRNEFHELVGTVMVLK